MPENDPKLPKVLEEFGVVAWQLPAAAMRHVPEHSHAEAQLCGLDAGLAILDTAAGSWLCPPGRCVWIPAGVAHSLRSCGRISGWMSRVRQVGGDELPAMPRVMTVSPLLKQVVLRVAGWVTDPTASAAKLRLAAVLRDEIAAAASVPLYLPMPSDPSLKRLAARLAEVHAGAASLATLAHEAGVSERSLFRRFQQETGLSPGQWRRQAQVLRAMELMAEGRSVTETALAVAYESPGSFSRAFRQVAGVTPAAYAKGQR